MNNLNIDADVVVEQIINRSRGRPRKEQKPITDDEVHEHVPRTKSQNKPKSMIIQM